LTEKQWSIPGMSRLIVAASNPTNLDVMVVMGYVTFASFVAIFTSLLGDLIISWLDPRVSITKNKS
jgi:oligopeptide transport system permease protein